MECDQQVNSVETTSKRIGTQRASSSKHDQLDNELCNVEFKNVGDALSITTSAGNVALKDYVERADEAFLMRATKEYNSSYIENTEYSSKPNKLGDKSSTVTAPGFLSPETIERLMMKQRGNASQLSASNHNTPMYRTTNTARFETLSDFSRYQTITLEDFKCNINKNQPKNIKRVDQVDLVDLEHEIPSLSGRRIKTRNLLREKVLKMKEVKSEPDLHQKMCSRNTAINPKDSSNRGKISGPRTIRAKMDVDSNDGDGNICISTENPELNSIIPRTRAVICNNFSARKKAFLAGDSARRRNNNVNEHLKTTDRKSACVPKTNTVRINVYDLLPIETYMRLPWGCDFPIGKCLNGVNSGLNVLGTGAYHAGVEVNGIEYAFGSNDTNNLSGVFTCFPQRSLGYEYRTTLDFGERQKIERSWICVPKTDCQQITSKGKKNRSSTSSYVYRERKSYADGQQVMKEMSKEFMGMDYDILRNNCCTFAKEACVRLGVPEEDIPTWFINIAEVGAVTEDTIANIESALLSPIHKIIQGECYDEEYPASSEIENNDEFEIVAESKDDDFSANGLDFRVIEKTQSMNFTEIVS